MKMILKAAFAACMWAALLPVATVAHANGWQCKSMGRNIADLDLRYALTHSQIPGQLATSHHKLRVAGRHYKLESVSQAQGLLALVYSGQLTQKSEGLIDGQLGFAPLYYAEQRGKKPVAETTIDLGNKQVLFRKNSSSAPMEAGLQDRLSMIYQLSARLQCNSKIDLGQALPMRVMSTGRLSTETWTLKAHETVALNLGEGERTVKTWQFESAPEDAQDEVVRIWYAEDLDWKPVKIQIQDADGKSLTQTLIGLGPLQPAGR